MLLIAVIGMYVGVWFTMMQMPFVKKCSTWAATKYQTALIPTLGVISSPCDAIQNTSENWREVLDRFARARDDDFASAQAACVGLNANWYKMSFQVRQARSKQFLF
jgi:hypothetical protein